MREPRFPVPKLTPPVAKYSEKSVYSVCPKDDQVVGTRLRLLTLDDSGRSARTAWTSRKEVISVLSALFLERYSKFTQVLSQFVRKH